MVMPMRYWTGTSHVFLLPKEERKQESTEIQKLLIFLIELGFPIPMGAHNNLTEKGQNAKLNSACCL